MNSSFSTLKGSLLEIVSDILDMLEQLHTASIEFTVKRDSGHIVGLETTLQCLLTEQKEMGIVKSSLKDVETGA